MPNNPEVLILAFITLLPAAAFLLLPLWRGGSQLFTIQVSSEFLQSPQARHLRRTYRAIVFAVGLLAFVVILRFVTPDATFSLALTPLAEIAALMCTWAWAWNATMPHRVPHAVVRTASLTAQDDGGAGWWLSTLPAVLPLIAAAAYLQLHWAQIPARFATHFGMDGTPNGFTDKSLAGVYWPLLTGLLLVCMMSVLGFCIVRFSRAGNSTLRRVTMNLLRLLCWFMAAMFCMAGLLPLASDGRGITAGWTGWFAVASVILLVGVGAYIFRSIARDKNFDKLQQTTSEQYWKWGLFYFNPDDSALLVPKRLGFGYTFNFGHPGAWMMVAGILALVAVPALLGTHLHMSGR